MSKIETALAKARWGLKRVETGGSAAPGTEIVALGQRQQVVRDAERVAATKALTRMDEPWLLDNRALAERRIIHAGMADIEALTAFRELRTKILRAVQKSSTIAVTSPFKDSGSELIAANLAASFSLDDSKTALLLDCNLGVPSLDHLISSAEAYGITDYLKNDDVRLDQIIHAVGVRRLRVIPAGRTHDDVAEYFTSTKMRELLDELHRRYIDRYIVLNAPPITESANARILVELADYAVLVVSYGRVTQTQVADAAKMIGDKKLLGVVFSDVPRERLGLPAWMRGIMKLWGKADHRKTKKK
jgi:protein-tyrosine kinase